MSRGWTGCLVVVGVIVLILLVLGGSLAGVYNRLVTQNEQVSNAWAQVQNVLQRRADLIPNLVETVKGYAAHEKEVFERVAEARSRLAGHKVPRRLTVVMDFPRSAAGKILRHAVRAAALPADGGATAAP